MKTISNSHVLENTEIAPDIFKMRVRSDKIASAAVAGQFAELYVASQAHLLPRPISICRANRGSGVLSFVYQKVGKGTAYFSGLGVGGTIKLVGPLGNGYDIAKAKRHLLVGGGIGIPPLVQLAADIRGSDPDGYIEAFLGYRSYTFLIDELKDLCDKLHIATEDGREGTKGNVIRLLPRPPLNECMVYSCGPKVMLKALHDWAGEQPLQVSMEERMACGIGACVGCAIKMKTRGDRWEYRKVCKDGPVFDAGEVDWGE